MWTSNNFCASAFNLHAPFLFFCLPDFLHPFLIGRVCFGCSAALWVACLTSFCPCCSDCENTLWVRVHGSVVAALIVVVALGQPRQDCQRVALGCLVGLFSVSCAMDSRLRRILSCSGVSATRWQCCCCCCFSCFVFPSGIVRSRCRMWRQ
ncbi:surface protease GP63 [Trypanosoma cruzi]|nr:surface protease GP63 [Trypanosoma cruzi]